MTRHAAPCFVLALLLLAGCRSAAGISGVVAGGVAGAATANAAVGYAVGIATNMAVDATLRYVGRKRQQAEQDAIAAVASGLAEGRQAAWSVRHDIPIGNEHGQVTVVRMIASPLAECREIAFSVMDDPPAQPAWYTTSICRQQERWKWAAAEPAVERWGFLQ